jgi:multidrug efflux pump subunit AcrA (membrane-fusion protein)
VTDAPTVAAGGKIAELCDLVADRKILVDKAQDLLKQAQAEYDEVEAQLFDHMENAGLVSVRTDRGLFRLNDLAWASVEDEDQARAWAEANMPELMMLNRQRLSVVVRKIIKGEEDAPGVTPGQTPPGVTFRTSRKITWRRS